MSARIDTWIASARRRPAALSGVFILILLMLAADWPYCGQRFKAPTGLATGSALFSTAWAASRALVHTKGARFAFE